MKQATVTIREVARHADVSVGTVSRVLNGHENIGEDTLRRVRAAMTELNYKTNDAARSLASRRGNTRRQTGNIGVLLIGMDAAWADHPLLAAYTGGIADACREHEYHPLLEFADRATTDAPARFLASQKVDGLLIKGGPSVPAWVSEVAKTLPVVGMAMHEPSLPIQQVMPDNRSAGAQVTEYLWRRGHRRIAYLCPQGRHRMFLHRLQGVQEFLRLQGGYDPGLMIIDDPAEGVDFKQPESALPEMSRQVAALWDRPAADRPTAIIAANDWIAAGIHVALTQRGLRVPDDVSLVGFDNVAVICASMRPALTSYEVPMRQTGYVAAKLLLRQIETPDAYVGQGIQLIAGRLVERDSVASVPGPDGVAALNC